MNKFKQGFVFAMSDFVNFFQKWFISSENLYKILFIKHLERFRWRTGQWRAWKNFDIAYRKVPAYQDFINRHGGYPEIPAKGLKPDLSIIPETDKKSYVKKYSTEERVVGGELPNAGVMVDESSGSSGTPTSWVRGWEEREVSKQMLQLAYHRVLGNEKAFVINAFALGAWATGLNVSMSLAEITIMKSTGPDIDKIINTLKEFGPRYHYIIMGYPPFLKSLVDDDRIDWKKYSASAAYGGEGMSESMRDYLLKTFENVYGSYGASDLEINISAENEFTVALRRIIMKNPQLREKLCWTDLGVTPMIFQYNPIAYYIETNRDRELVITLTRRTNIAPKIRYNIHDRGHVWRYPALWKIIKEESLAKEFSRVNHKLDLPLLFYYGRSDMSIDYFGANVTPDSIREILFGIERLAPKLNTFRLMQFEDKHHDKRMEIAIELCENEKNDFKASGLGKKVFETLADVNRDFYNAYYNTAKPDQHPKLSIHEFRKGPFEGGQRKLKNEYVETDLKYDKV